MSANIQQARDVLAKWRDRSIQGAVRDVARMVHPDDANLIVGTAGNPDLLDEINRLLVESDGIDATPGDWERAERFAAAIIAADERMTS